MTASVRKVLEDARALVAKGWTQGMLWGWKDGVRCCCAVGALGSVVPIGVDLNPARAALRNAAGLSAGESITEWNDAPGRTQAEVLAAFDRAIAGCE